MQPVGSAGRSQSLRRSESLCCDEGGRCVQPSRSVTESACRFLGGAPTIGLKEQLLCESDISSPAHNRVMEEHDASLDGHAGHADSDTLGHASSDPSGQAISSEAPAGTYGSALWLVLRAHGFPAASQ